MPPAPPAACHRVLRSSHLDRVTQLCPLPVAFLDRPDNSRRRRWCAMSDCDTHEEISSLRRASRGTQFAGTARLSVVLPTAVNAARVDPINSFRCAPASIDSSTGSPRRPGCWIGLFTASGRRRSGRGLAAAWTTRRRRHHSMSSVPAAAGSAHGSASAGLWTGPSTVNATTTSAVTNAM
jgi:hypothetical protein